MLAKHSMLIGLLVLAAGTLSSAASLKLPSYFKTCGQKDPKLDECALESTKAALPNLLNGDPKYNIPSLKPLFIEMIDITQKGGLNLFLKNINVHGIEDIVFKEIKLDVNNLKIKFVFTVPTATLIGSYKIDGKILVLPIKGEGPCNITLNDLDLVYRTDFELIKKEDGKEYLLPKNAKIEYKTSRAYIKLENLFNGDKALGETTNKFLDENWKDLVSELGPALAEALSLIATQVLTNIASKVAYEDLWAK